MEYNEYHLVNSEDQRIHYPYQLETVFLNAVSNGDYEGAIATAGQLLGSSDYEPGTFAQSQKKQTEYTIVIMIGLLCRAVIAGGVPPQIAYDKSDLLLYEFSEQRSLNEQEYIIKLVRTYCQMVLDSKKGSGHSLHVRRCKDYIYKNITEHLTVEDIASSLSLSPNYLSKLFCLEEGITIKKYILHERISLSENMLKYSDYSIGMIAERFSFSSEAHFCTVFKKETGMSPLKYRNLHTRS